MLLEVAATRLAASNSGELVRLRANLASRDADVASASGDLERLRADLDRLNADVASRDAELERLRTDVVTKDADVESASGELERLHRVAVERGDEDRRRHRLGAHLADHVEPGLPRHLHIRHDDVAPFRG